MKIIIQHVCASFLCCSDLQGNEKWYLCECLVGNTHTYRHTIVRAKIDFRPFNPWLCWKAHFDKSLCGQEWNCKIYIVMVEIIYRRPANLNVLRVLYSFLAQNSAHSRSCNANLNEFHKKKTGKNSKIKSRWFQAEKQGISRCLQ